MAYRGLSFQNHCEIIPLSRKKKKSEICGQASTCTVSCIARIKKKVWFLYYNYMEDNFAHPVFITNKQSCFIDLIM